MMHTRRKILIIKRGMSTFRINDIEMTDAPQKMNLTPYYALKVFMKYIMVLKNMVEAIGLIPLPKV